MTEPNLRRMQAIAFARNNGLIMRTLVFMENRYKKLSDTQKLLEGDGVSKEEFITSIRFLSGEGYLKLRRIGSEEPGNVVDHDYTELEVIITTGPGMRLMMGSLKDDLVEV